MTKKREEINSLSHTKWNCMYHVVFIPKYRRKSVYGKLRRDIGTYIRRLCDYKNVEIIEANACIDHIHMLVSIPPKYSVSQIMGYLKGKSSLMIFERHLKIFHYMKAIANRGRGISDLSEIIVIRMCTLVQK